MRVLFVYKGEGPSKRNSVIDAQVKSMENEPLEIITFPLSTSGLLSYFFAYRLLLKFLKETPVDLIHAHYSYSGFISGLTGKKTVCSLMGSDIFDQPLPILWLTKLFSRFIWKETIVKSSAMQRIFPNAIEIPNGVDFSIFKPMDQQEASTRVGFDPEKKNIIFVAEHPQASVKNLKLAKEAVTHLSDSDINLEIISGKNQEELVDYYNAADLLLMTSLSEGSPNVVKEAMACNCPVVSTNVGDVSERIKNTQGCFVSDFNVNELADCIMESLNRKKRTEGRKDIQMLKKEVISARLMETYKSVI